MNVDIIITDDREITYTKTVDSDVFSRIPMVGEAILPNEDEVIVTRVKHPLPPRKNVVLQCYRPTGWSARDQSIYDKDGWIRTPAY